MTGRINGKYDFCGQSPRHADFQTDMFLILLLFYYGVLFLNRSQSFLLAVNEQRLTHTIGNYLFNEAEVNADLNTV